MRIYDKITEEVAPQLQKLESLLTFSEDPAKTRENLGLVCVISSYIKRRSNLILLGEEASFLPAQELEYCLREYHGKSKALRSSGFVIVQMQRHTVKGFFGGGIRLF